MPMLMPRRVKHRKVMRGRMSGNAKGGHTVAFGEYGLATLEPAWITAHQIESARRAMTRSVKRGGKIWIRIFRTSPRPRSPPRPASVPARALRITGSPSCAPAGSCSRWQASSAKQPLRPCAWRRTSSGGDSRRRPRDREGGHRWRSVRSVRGPRAGRPAEGGEAGPLAGPVRPLDPAAEGLQPDPGDTTDHRPDPHRPARAFDRSALGRVGASGCLPQEQPAP